jgi:VIT1/CCC1 family predicted Fe2+/Mn2+ transporter
MALLYRAIRLPVDREYFMAWFSGSEGGLSTTSAIIAGLMVSSAALDLIALTAVISFTVQAFNSAIGSFSSNRTFDEIERQDIVKGYRKPAIDAALQFLSHVLMGAIVLSPIIFVTNAVEATIMSIAITLFFLFVIGYFKGRIVKRNPYRDGLELVLLGALIISVGITAGIILSQ